MTILQVADHHSLDLPPSYDHMDRSYAYGYQEPRYPVPANIGYVSLGQDYQDMVYIDSADSECPKIVYCLDLWTWSDEYWNDLPFYYNETSEEWW